MKILLTSDIHLSDKSPSMCTESYLDDLFDLLRECSRQCLIRDARAFVIAGDLFDNKIPFRNSHKLVQMLISILKDFPCEVYIVPGNHDETGDKVQSVFTTQPLGIVYRSDAAKLLMEWNDSPPSEYSEFGGSEALPIFGVPWLAEWDYKDKEEVRDQAVQNALVALTEDEGNEDPLLVVTHAPFFPPGQESPYENYPVNKFAKFVRNAVEHSRKVSVFYGHIHDYHGSYMSDNGITFANSGALSRGSLSEYNLKRPIRLAEWDSNTGEFDIFEINHKPAEEVFLLEKAAEIKKSQLEADSFLENVGTTVLEKSSTENVINIAREKNIHPRVVKVIEKLLNEVF